MKQERTGQWLHQNKFLKAKGCCRMRLLAALCFALAVVGTLTLWLLLKCETSWKGCTRVSHRGSNVKFTWNTHDSGLSEDMQGIAKRNIWFLETSSRRTLTPREACSIESACLHNPHYTVHLLSTGNITDADCQYHRVLSALPNFSSEPLNESTELAGTPLISLYTEGAVLRSPYFTAHLSDFLRYAVLWKRGGVYLDSDVIIFRSLNGITNSAVYQDDSGTVANGILLFDAHHPVLEALMYMCAYNYDPEVWATCGPEIMSILPKYAQHHEHVNFLKKNTFLAVPYQEWESFFESDRTEWVMKVTNGSYGAHFWNKLSKERSVRPGSGCAVDVMARVHCPNVYELASLQSYF